MQLLKVSALKLCFNVGTKNIFNAAEGKTELSVQGEAFQKDICM